MLIVQRYSTLGGWYEYKPGGCEEGMRKGTMVAKVNIDIYDRCGQKQRSQLQSITLKVAWTHY